MSFLLDNLFSLFMPFLISKFFDGVPNFIYFATVLGTPFVCLFSAVWRRCFPDFPPKGINKVNCLSSSVCHTQMQNCESALLVSQTCEAWASLSIFSRMVLAEILCRELDKNKHTQSQGRISYTNRLWAVVMTLARQSAGCIIYLQRQ